jgi:hypothetical protein
VLSWDGMRFFIFYFLFFIFAVGLDGIDALWVGPVGEFAWCALTWPPFVDPPSVGSTSGRYFFLFYYFFCFLCFLVVNKIYDDDVKHDVIC